MMLYPDTIDAIGVVTSSDTAPDKPATGDLWWDIPNTELMMWDGYNWVRVGGGGGIWSGDTPPDAPFDGMLWYDEGSDLLMIWDADGNPPQWVPVSGGQSPTVNLSYTATALDGVINNTGGSDATVPAADESSAGLMLPGDKVKIDYITVTQDIDLDNLPAGVTNLGYTSKVDGGTVTSSTGTDADLVTVSDTVAGLMTPGQKGHLDGIEAGADVTDTENVSAAGAAVVEIGIGPPTGTPAGIGHFYVDTANNELWWAENITGPSGWIQVQSGAFDGTIDYLSNVETMHIIGRLTAGEGNSEELTKSDVLGFLNVEDGANNYVHPSHSGDVTGSGALTINQGAVSLGKMQIINSGRMLGRNDPGTGVVEQLSAADVRSLINVEDGAKDDLTPAEIKSAYESNPQTNAYTDDEKTKLANLAADANNYVHPNHSGDVTSTGDGATVIGNNKVTNAKLALSPAWSFKGNATGAQDVASDFQLGNLLQSELPQVGAFLFGFNAAGNFRAFNYDNLGILSGDVAELIQERWQFADGIHANWIYGYDPGGLGFTAAGIKADAVVLDGASGVYLRANDENLSFGNVRIGSVDPVNGLAQLLVDVPQPAHEIEDISTSGDVNLAQAFTSLPVNLVTEADYSAGSILSLIGSATNTGNADDTIIFQVTTQNGQFVIGQTLVSSGSTVNFAHSYTTASVTGAASAISFEASRQGANGVVAVHANATDPLTARFYEPAAGGGGGLSDVTTSGTGNTLINSNTGGVVELKGLVAGTGVTIVDENGGLTLGATAGGGDPEQLINVDADRIIGRVSPGTGVSEELTAAQVLTLIGVEANADVTDSVNVNAAGATMITSGTGAPQTAPTKVGHLYVDLTNDVVYISTDTTGAGDWRRIYSTGYAIEVDYVSNVASSTLLGRTTAGDGNSEELSATAARALLNVEDGANNYTHPSHTGDVTGSGALTIANGAVTLPKMANIDQGDWLARQTAGAGAPEALNTAQALALLGIDAGANNYVHPNHSGDVTSDGDGTQTIANGAVTLTKMADIGTGTIMGRDDPGDGSPEVLSPTQARAVLNVEDGANAYVHPNHTGDVTGVTALTIGAGKVTYAKMQSMPTGNLLGNNTGSNNPPTDLTKAEAQALLNVADGANNYSHPNHSGDVTSTGDGATVIANDAVTYAKMQNQVGAGLLGRTSGGGLIGEVSATNVRSFINVENNADVTDAANVAAAGATMINGTHNEQAGLKMAVMTQANYDGISPAADTLYFISG